MDYKYSDMVDFDARTFMRQRHRDFLAVIECGPFETPELAHSIAEKLVFLLEAMADRKELVISAIELPAVIDSAASIKAASPTEYYGCLEVGPMPSAKSAILLADNLGESLSKVSSILVSDPITLPGGVVINFFKP